MRISFTSILTLLIASFVLIGCDKMDLKKDKHNCKKGKELKDKYVYEPLIEDAECGCIVSGKVKYLENGKTTALVDYGNGECDNKAVKTTCIDGDCDHKKSEKIEFEFDCDKEKASDFDKDEDDDWEKSDDKDER